MISRSNTFLILLLLLSLFSFSAGKFEDFNNGMNLHHSPYKDGTQMEMRKLLMLDGPDYDDPVANSKHVPKKPSISKP